MEDFFKIGIITSSHGVRGEMKVYPTTDDSRRFKRLKEVFVEGKSGLEQYEVESARVTTDKVLLKLKGIDTPEEAVKLRQRGIFVDREHAVRLSKDEYFIADLIDIKIIDENDNELGVLTDVFHTLIISCLALFCTIQIYDVEMSRSLILHIYGSFDGVIRINRHLAVVALI